MMSLPRMRTATGVMVAIKEHDPDTEVTLHYVRYIINAGLVPVVHVGRKKLVDVDAVIAYLSSGAPMDEPGIVRRVVL